MGFKKGDIIVSDSGIERRIVRVYRNQIGCSYLWEYPDLPSGENNLFDSRNSNDREFLWNGWKLKE